MSDHSQWVRPHFQCVRIRPSLKTFSLSLKSSCQITLLENPGHNLSGVGSMKAQAGFQTPGDPAGPVNLSRHI